MHNRWSTTLYFQHCFWVQRKVVDLHRLLQTFITQSFCYGAAKHPQIEMTVIELFVTSGNSSANVKQKAKRE